MPMMHHAARTRAVATPLLSVLQAFRERVMRSPSAVAQLRGWNRTIEIRTPRGPVYLEIDEGVVGEPTTSTMRLPDISVTGDVVSLTAVFGGHLSPIAAFVEGQLVGYAGLTPDRTRLDAVLGTLAA